MNEYSVQKLEESGLYFEHPDRFAFMRTDSYRNIYGHPMSEAKGNEIGGYVEIKNVSNGKKIYRKYRGCNKVEDNHVMLDYRTICELQLSAKNEERFITVKKSNWWKFYFRNSDPGIKFPALLAFFGLLFTLISMILSIIFYFFPNCCL